MRPKKTFLIVGDSLSLGVTEALKSKVLSVAPELYTTLLRRRLPDWNLIVNAELHRKTPRALEVLPALLDEHRTDVVLLLLGGSDADLDWRRFLLTHGRTVRCMVPVNTFRQALRTLANMVLARGAVPLICDMPLCNLEVRARWLTRHTGIDVGALVSAGGGQPEADRRARQYIDAAYEVAVALGVPFVPYGERMLELDKAVRHGPDGYHPGAAAHPLIAACVYAALPPFQTIPARPPADVISRAL